MRDFWHTSSLGMTVFAAAYLLRVVDAAAPADGLVWASIGLHAAGAALMVWPLFRLPSLATIGAARTQLWLDIGILMTAAGVLIWVLGYRLAQGYHFGRPVPEPDFLGARMLGTSAGSPRP